MSQDRTGCGTPNPDGESLNLREVRTEAETEAIYRALERTNKNISQASRMLGVPRPTLYNLIAKYVDRHRLMR
ncbi:MAG: helix-turn-helix domain-containing protein [Gammaproteobacteria bacterium]|nr:helix-turn-helix domain-containing protein [Gammaproteobacteria bacterium]